MASAIEALGMSLPNSSMQAAVSTEERRGLRQCRSSGFEFDQTGIRPKDILTRKAFENAITVVIALGDRPTRSAPLAIAHASGIKLSLDDFTRVGGKFLSSPILNPVDVT